MKVRDLLNKLSMGSNAKVTVYDASCEGGKEWKMFYDAMRQNNYCKWEGDKKVDVGALKLNHFLVYNNEIVIYAE